MLVRGIRSERVASCEPDIRPDLNGAELSKAALVGADLTNADLTGAELGEANLSKANLSNTNLMGADFTGADLSEFAVTAALDGRPDQETMLEIAGGVYHELCEIPPWNAELGSGGRAASAISALSPGSTLHTYTRDPKSAGIDSLKTLGVHVRAHESNVSLAFAYFHTLSRPHIEPPLDNLDRNPPIHVAGDTVLRFGFLEGDAVVRAHRAIYDPQNSARPQPFNDNGSSADELAIILNEVELRGMTKLNDIRLGAERLMQIERAAAVVVKQGPRGALVFERHGVVHHVPAYRSERVFKIGTGDVFSAIFAAHWGEARVPAAYAADLASRSVAAYCARPRLPLRSDATEHLQPIPGSSPGPILLESAIDTIGRCYVFEEARFQLGIVGGQVFTSGFEPASVVPAAMLVLSDGMKLANRERIQRAHDRGTPIVLLAEEAAQPILDGLPTQGVTMTDDFASALYFAVWAASSGARSNKANC
jgi:hypothetical protein